jgi:hypothetical protein
MEYPVKLLDKQRPVAIYHLGSFITKHIFSSAKHTLDHRVPVLSRYFEKATLQEVDREEPKEVIVQEIVTAIQSMLRSSTAGAKNV